MKALIAHPKGALSLINVGRDLAGVLAKHGFEVDVREYPGYRRPFEKWGYAVNVSHPVSLWFDAHHMLINPYTCRRIVHYYVIEGVLTRRRTWPKRRIVAPSNFAKRCIELSGGSVERVVSHQVDPEVNEDMVRKWREKLPKNKPLLVYVGSNIMRKGLDLLERAGYILRDRGVKCSIIVFTDNHRAPFHYNVDNMFNEPPFIKLIGFGKHRREEVWALIKASDALIHPAYVEGFGLPVAEAVMLKVPVICLNAPGVNELVSPRTSFMVTSCQEWRARWGVELEFQGATCDPRDLADMVEVFLDASSDVRGDVASKAYEELAPRVKESYKWFVEHASR